MQFSISRILNQYFFSSQEFVAVHNRLYSSFYPADTLYISNEPHIMRVFMNEFTILCWSRNWEEFDYDAEYARLVSGLPPSLDGESYSEFIRWLMVNHPGMYL